MISEVKLIYLFDFAFLPLLLGRFSLSVSRCFRTLFGGLILTCSSVCGSGGLVWTRSSVRGSGGLIWTCSSVRGSWGSTGEGEFWGDGGDSGGGFRGVLELSSFFFFK